jgi:ankyrin repeat protein
MFDHKIVEKNLKNIDINLLKQLAIATINEPLTEFGQTWLHFLSYHGNQFWVKIFLDYGSNIKLADKFGNTALHYAAMKDSVEVGRLLIELEPTLVNGVNLNDDTALHYACLLGNNKFVDLLLKQNASLSKLNNDHLSPLHYAIGAGYGKDVHHIIDKGIKVAELDDNGYSVLHMSAVLGDIDTSKIIIEHDESSNLLNQEDEILQWSPLHFTKIARNKEMVDFFKQQGAIDSPPIFSNHTISRATESAKKLLCDTEAAPTNTTASVVTWDGSLASIMSPGGFLYYASYSPTAALNYTIARSLLLKLVNGNFAKNGWYSDFMNNYCSKKMLENVLEPDQVISLKHAELYLGENHQDYVALGDSCMDQGDLVLRQFEDLGFSWSLCSLTGDVSDLV